MEGVDFIYFAFLSIFKFAIFVPTYIVSSKLTFWEALLFSGLTGISGIILLVNLSTWIWNLLEKLKSWAGFSRKNKPVKITPGRRRLVRFRKKYGLWGLAFLSPILISLPLGCFLAVRYYHTRTRIMLIMSLGVLFWSLIFSAFGSVIVQWIEKLP